MKSLVFYFALIGFVLSPLTVAHASPPPLDRRHGSAPFEHDHPHPHPAAKQLAAADLDAGEPRTVRTIYFTPNDRSYNSQAVAQIKKDLRKAQAFFAEQMQAHGYGNKTFRFETDAQGEPLVHRVDGQRPESHYFLNGVFQGFHSAEVEKAMSNFSKDIYDENIYVFYSDLSIEINSAVGSRRSKRGGYVDYPFTNYRDLEWQTLAHELGHAFGLGHDFRDRAYVMSYGPGQNRLSACSAQFLSVHPYFDSAIPLEDVSPPRISILSPTRYPPGSSTISIQLKISHSAELHQVIVRNGIDVVTWQELDGKEAIVTFDYDGFFALAGFRSLPDVVAHPIFIEVIDTKGNMTSREFRHGEKSPHLITTLQEEPLPTGGRHWPKVLFSPDGKTLVSFGDQITLWDVATLTRTAIFYAHDYWVGSVSFSPDGKTLASTGIFDKAIKLFDVVAHRHIATLRHSNTILKVSFSPDGKTLASGNTDEITLWDVATRTKTATLDPPAGHSAWDNRIDLLSFSPDGSILAAASPTSTIALWDMATRTRIKRFPNEHQIVALSFSPDGSILASGQAGGDVYLWDVKGQKQQIGGCDHAGAISSVVFSPKQDLFVTAGTDGEVFLWDTDTQETVAILAQISPVAAVSFSPTQNIMVSSEEGSQLFLWDMSEWLEGSPPTLPKTSGGADNPVIVQTLSEQTADSSDDSSADSSDDSSADSSDDSSVNVQTTSDLTADTAYEVTEAKLKRGVGVSLYLSSTYEYEPSIESIPEAVTVSGIPGVTVFGWGRLSDRRLIVDIGFSGDLDSDAVLTFTVAADAIADYDGPPFSAQIPVTASQEDSSNDSSDDSSADSSADSSDDSSADSSADSSDDSSVNVQATPDLTADTAYEVTEAKLKRGVGVSLYLSSTYEYEPSIESIPEAVTVSGIPGVTVFGWGRLGDRWIVVDIGFSGDLDRDAQLTFTVAAEAIADYNGPPLSAQIPVTASQENALTANFPNPFNPETYISYQLAEPSEITLTIYALNGQVVRRLVQAHQAAGAHEAYWDGRSAFGQPVASGVYFYRLTAGDFTATRKMLIQK